MARKSLLQRVGGFDLTLRRAQDLHMWVRLARAADLFFVPKAVALYRQHRASVSHEDAPPEDWSIAAYNLLLGHPDFQEHQSLLRRKLGYFHNQNAYYHRMRGRKDMAIQAASFAVWYSPLDAHNWKNFLATLLRMP